MCYEYLVFSSDVSNFIIIVKYVNVVFDLKYVHENVYPRKGNLHMCIGIYTGHPVVQEITS